METALDGEVAVEEVPELDAGGAVGALDAAVPLRPSRRQDAEGDAEVPAGVLEAGQRKRAALKAVAREKARATMNRLTGQMARNSLMELPSRETAVWSIWTSWPGSPPVTSHSLRLPRSGATSPRHRLAQCHIYLNQNSGRMLTPSPGSGIEIEPCARHTTFERLLKYTYRRRYLSGLGQRPAHFRAVAAMAEQVPAFRVKRPAHPLQINALADEIERSLCEHGADEILPGSAGSGGGLAPDHQSDHDSQWQAIVSAASKSITYGTAPALPRVEKPALVRCLGAVDVEALRARVMAQAAAPYGCAEPVYPKAMLARLAAGHRIDRHMDGEGSHPLTHRIQVPLQTNPRATLTAALPQAAKPAPTPRRPVDAAAS